MGFWRESDCQGFITAANDYASSVSKKMDSVLEFAVSGKKMAGK